MPKKKFIDKKNSVTFNVVHRSQKDPLAVDEDAPQHVLMPVAAKKPKQENPEKRQEEQRKFGIFYDDDYDYLQHVKSVEEQEVELVPIERVRIPAERLGPSTSAGGPNLKLPSNVFASATEEDVGLLNKAAPAGLRLDWDPDVLAAMDDDFDFDDPDNQLDDDFIQLANAERGDDDDEEREFGTDEEGSWTDESGEEDDFNSSDMGDSVPSLKGGFRGEDAKSSRFTEYSMSSSVIRRNAQLTLLDDKFEHMMAGYDDNEIGALDCDEIEGRLAVDSEMVMKCAEDFAQQQKKLQLEKEAIKNRAQMQESDDDDMVDLKVEARTREKWDCESVLSTYSNIYNHPKLIPREPTLNKKIKISAKTGLPVGVLGRGLTAAALATLEGDGKRRDKDEMSEAISVLSTLSVRPKEESREEKSARKQALKEYRRERRVERKANKLAFKEETKKQQKLVISQKANINTVKIV